MHVASASPEVILTPRFQGDTLVHPRILWAFGSDVLHAPLRSETSHGVVVSASPWHSVEAERVQMERMVYVTVVKPCSEYELEHTKCKRGHGRDGCRAIVSHGLWSHDIRRRGNQSTSAAQSCGVLAKLAHLQHSPIGRVTTRRSSFV